MKASLSLIRNALAAWLVLVAASHAAPTLQDPVVGNVTTTSVSVCFEASEAAVPVLRIYGDAAGTLEVTNEFAIEFQFLSADRREVASDPASRTRAREIQGAMNDRLVYLAKVSGLEPGSDYWVQPAVRDPVDASEDAGALLPVTTAARAAFIVEARQLIIDFGGVGDLTGTVVSLANGTSPYPLFSVVGDGLSGSRVYFDLTHFLEGSGETQLVPASGTTLLLTVGLKGGELGPGTLAGTDIAFTGTPTAALSSTATFTPDALVLVAAPRHSTALAGHPLLVDFRAEDALGALVTDFDRPLTLTSPALEGGSLVTASLVDGVLTGQGVTLMSEGEQTVTVVDPVTAATTTMTLDVLPYTYDNFRTHYYGNTTDPAGDLPENGDGDSYTNLEEFAYGLNPEELNAPLVLGDGFAIEKRGGPVTSLRIDADGVDFRVTFLRPRNHASLGLNYTPRFSPDLSVWFDANTTPTVEASDGDVELVTYQYPLFTPDARKARFFTIAVNLN